LVRLTHTNGQGRKSLAEDFGTAAREDIMEKLVEICFEIVIIALICVSLFSGQPAFETTQAKANPAPIALMAP
jgi:hypothetical protein